MCKTLNETLDTRALRDTLGYYPTGVAVVTAAADCESPVGMTINSFHAISLEPALVGWCLDRRSASFQAFRRCGEFSLSFLDESQGEVARRFATRGKDKFVGIDVIDQAGPLIPEACAWLRCRLHRQVPLGDHLMLIGKVTAFSHRGGRPMVFSRSKFGGVAVQSQPVNPPVKSVASAA